MERCVPAVRLGEVVGECDAVELCERCRVEWILRDGDENAGLVGRDERVEEERDACRRAGREEDILWVTRETIALCQGSQSS